MGRCPRELHAPDLDSSRPGPLEHKLGKDVYLFEIGAGERFQWNHLCSPVAGHLELKSQFAPVVWLRGILYADVDELTGIAPHLDLQSLVGRQIRGGRAGESGGPAVMNTAPQACPGG
jgi:hypothetical protein